MSHPHRYAVALDGAASLDVGAAVDAMFTPGTATALLDGCRGYLCFGAPSLADAESGIKALGEEGAELALKAEAYAEFATSWFGLAEGTTLLKTEVSVLAEAWNGFPEGSVALRLETNRGAVTFVRNDVTIGLRTGNVFHHRNRARAESEVTALYVEDGSAGDAALTLAEYASFLIPGVGPIGAGLINILHTWLRPPHKPAMPGEEIVREIGLLMKKLMVIEDQAAVEGAYLDYSSAMANAKESDKESVANFRTSAFKALDQNGTMVRAFNSLTLDSALAQTGIRAWCFAASFMLLALRHATTLSSQHRNIPVASTDYWRRLRLAYHEILTHIGNVMCAEQKGLKERLAKIGPVERWTHQDFAVMPRGILIPRTVFDGYGFTDDGKRAGLKAPDRDTSDENQLHSQAVADRDAYYESKHKEFLRTLYGETDDVVRQIQSSNESLVHAWHYSLEDTVLAAVKGWNPGDEYPVLAAWPNGSLNVEGTSGVRQDAWQSFLDSNSGEMGAKELHLKPDTPVFRFIGSGEPGPGGGALKLKVPSEKGKIYALRVRYTTTEYLRTFRVHWASDTSPGNDAAHRVLAPNARHQDAKQRWWISRSITLPVEAHHDGDTLVLDGFDGWAPDIVSLEWFELEGFPLLGS